MSLMERTRRFVLGEPVEAPPGTPAHVTIRRGRIVPGIGGLLARMNGPAAAVTLGRTVVVSPDAPLTPGLLAHELVHVRQWQADPLFPVRYTLATLRHGYRDNPYEIEARALSAPPGTHPRAEELP